MNKTTLIFLAIGGALFFGASKLFGKPASSSLPTQGQSAFGKVGNAAVGAITDLANQALGAIPPQYGFKTPGIAPLGNGQNAKAGQQAGITASINLNDFLKSAGGFFGGLFKSSPKAPKNDYGPPAPNALLNNPYYEGARPDDISVDPAFLGAIGVPTPDQPLNTTEGLPEINNPFLYDAPGGADYTDFSEPETAAV